MGYKLSIDTLTDNGITPIGSAEELCDFVANCHSPCTRKEAQSCSDYEKLYDTYKETLDKLIAEFENLGNNIIAIELFKKIKSEQADYCKKDYRLSVVDYVNKNSKVLNEKGLYHSVKALIKDSDFDWTDKTLVEKFKINYLMVKELIKRNVR